MMGEACGVVAVNPVNETIAPLPYTVDPHWVATILNVSDCRRITTTVLNVVLRQVEMYSESHDGCRQNDNWPRVGEEGTGVGLLMLER